MLVSPFLLWYTWQLDLSDNQLCSVNLYGCGTYDTEGITAIAGALRITGSVILVNVLSNRLSMESASLLLKVKTEKPNLRTLCGLTHDETELDLSRRHLGPGDAKLLAPEILVMSSVTRVDIRHNNVAGDAASQLSAAVLANTKIEVFNEIPIKEMRTNSLIELNLKRKYIGVVGGMVVAALLPAMGSITRVS